MAGELVFSLVFRAIDQATGTVGKVSSALRQATGAASSAARAAGEASERFSRSFAGMGAIVAEGFSLRAVATQNEFFRRLQINTGLSDGAITQLRETLRSAASAARVSGDDMLDAFKAFKGLGGDVAVFQDNADTIAAAIQLLGGHAEELGELFATLQTRMHLKTPTEFLDTLATIKKQMAGVEGGVDSFAAAAPLLMTTYAALKHSGPDATKELGATFAVIAKGTNSARQARSLTEQFLTSLSDPAKQVELAHNGIKVWNDPTNRYSDVRSATDIIGQIAAAFARDPNYAGDQFGKEWGQALKVPISEIKTTGHSATLEGILGAQGDGTAFLRQAREASEGLTGSLNALRDAVREVAEADLTEPINLFAKALSACAGPLGRVVMVLAVLAAVGHVIGWIAGAVAGFKAFAAVLGALRLGALASGLWAVVPALAAVVVEMWGAAAAALANPITWIVLAVIAAVAVFATEVYLIYRYWGDIVAWFRRLWTDVATTFDGLWTDVVEPLKTFDPLKWIKPPMEAMTKWLASIDLSEIGRKIIDSLVDGLRRAFNALPEPVHEALGGAWEGVRSATDAVASGAGAIWDGTKWIGRGIASGVGSAIDAITGDHAEAANKAVAYFEKMGWSHQQAAGIAANLNAESGFNPALVGDNGAAYGIAQWHRDRQAAFAAWTGHDIRSATTAEQLAFVHHELTTGGERAAGLALETAKTAAEAGAIVSRLYERPFDREGEASRRAAGAEALAAAPTPSAFGVPMKNPDGRVTVRIDGLPDGARARVASTPGWDVDLGHHMLGVPG